MRRPRTALRLTLLPALLLVAASPAAAGTICVPDASADASCTDPGATTQATLQAALDAAAAANGPDTIRLGAGTFAGASDLAGDSSTTTVAGAGRSQTTISGSGSGPILLLTGNFVVQDLTIARTGGAQIVAQFGAALLRRVDVTRASAPSALEEVLNYSGSSPNSLGLDDVGIQQPSGSANALVAVATTINNLNIASGATGNYAVLGTDVTLRNARIATGAASAGIALYGTSSVAGAQVAVSGADVDGIRALAFAADTSVQVDDATLVNTTTGATGAALSSVAIAAGRTSALTARGVAASGFAQGICASTEDPAAVATIGLSYSVVGTTISGACPATHGFADTGTQTPTVGTGVPAATPAFANLVEGDYTPAVNGNLVDLGSPDARAVGLPATDLDGNARVIDGDGDSTARIDIGAYERAAPTPPTGGGGTGGAGGGTGGGGTGTGTGTGGGGEVADGALRGAVQKLAFRGRLMHATRASSRPVGILKTAPTGTVPALVVTLERPTAFTLTLKRRGSDGKYRALKGAYTVAAQAGTTVYLKVTGSWNRRVLKRGVYRFTAKGPEGLAAVRLVRVR